MDSDHRAGVYQVTHPVPIGDRIDGVLAQALEAELLSQRIAVHRKWAPGNGTRAQGQNGRSVTGAAHSLDVAQKREHVRERPMCGADRLCLLEVRVTGHHRVDTARREVAKCTAQCSQVDLDALGGGHAVRPDSRGRLVVPGAPGVQLAGDITGSFSEHALDDRVDVLFRRVSEAVFIDPGFHYIQTGQDGLDFRLRQDLGPTQRTRPCPAAADVLTPQALVDMQAEVERDHLGGHLALETPPPQRSGDRCRGVCVAQSAPASTTSSISLETACWLVRSLPAMAAAARMGRPKRRMKPSASA